MQTFDKQFVAFIIYVACIINIHQIYVTPYVYGVNMLHIIYVILVTHPLSDMYMSLVIYGLSSCNMSHI